MSGGPANALIGQRLPASLSRVVSQKLEGGEKVVWVGQPNFWLTLRSNRLGVALAATGSLAVALLGLFGRNETVTGGIAATAIFGLTSMAVLVAWPIHAYWRSKCVAYVLTDHRATIVHLGARGARVEVYTVAELQHVWCENVTRHGGDVVFDREVVKEDGSTYTVPKGFLNVTSPESVRDKVRSVAGRRP